MTQYALAVDRGHPSLGRQASGLHPGLLKLIASTIAVPILMGLGINKLSVPVSAMAEIKARVRTLSFVQCRGVAESALRSDSAEEIATLVQEKMPL